MRQEDIVPFVRSNDKRFITSGELALICALKQFGCGCWFLSEVTFATPFSRKLVEAACRLVIQLIENYEKVQTLLNKPTLDCIPVVYA